MTAHLRRQDEPEGRRPKAFRERTRGRLGEGAVPRAMAVWLWYGGLTGADEVRGPCDSGQRIRLSALNERCCGGFERRIQTRRQRRAPIGRRGGVASR
jgi:hypothetical protein